MKNKKRIDFISIILVIITLGFGLAAFIVASKETQYSKYLTYIVLICLVFSLSVLISRVQQMRQRRHIELLEQRLNMWNSISYRVKKAGETAFNELPIGILVISENYDIIWSNNYAKHIFMSPLEEMNIEHICKDLSKGLAEQDKFVVKIYGKVYDICYIKEYGVVYLTEITQVVEIKDKYQQRLTAVGYINIDNLEEALSDLDVQERAEYMWKIIGIIAKWAESFGTYVRAYSDNHYLIVMDYSQLQAMIKANFSILDDIKTILHITNVGRISLSIGIACIDENIEDLSKHANEQLELALNRGGDQAVVRINDEVKFFGAKTDAVPKESKVEVRIKSEELQELIKKSSRVIVVGHRALDADGFGGTLGIYKIAKSLGKDAYMVIDPKNIDATVERIYNTITNEYVLLMDDICTPNQALSLMDDNTLLMVVDCQTDVLVSDSRLVKKAKKIGIIDHHRKSQGAINNALFSYTSTSASSSVELVVELMEFLEKEITFDSLESTWMLLGIIVDTNNFIYRASAKTFAVASILAKNGADMAGVKKYLKEDYNEKVMRNEFIDNVEIYKERVGIAVGKTDLIYERATLAKISDEIISIDGVDVGITVGFIKDKVIGISARSLGIINAQILMEKMGGGGHLNNAAAQIQDTDLQSVVNQLKIYVDEYLNKEEYMKVILIKEVKGRGKKGDVIELQPGFANHLIRTEQAIIGSPENLKKVEAEKREAEIQAEAHLQQMKELKKLIESKPIKIAAKIGAEGKMFGSISMKQVVDEFEKQTGVALDKRKINFVDNITTLGTYEIPIQLHKEVVATITVYVVEKE